MLNRLAYVWERYQWNLKHRPYRTNACTASTISMFGDILAQSVFKRLSHPPPATTDSTNPSSHNSSSSSSSAPASNKLTSSSWWLVELPNKHRDVIDLRRSLIFGSFSALFGTPFWLLVYKFVDRGIPAVTIRTAIQKGMITWVMANSTNPIFIAYITTADHCMVRGKHISELWGSNGSAGSKIWNKIATDLPVIMSYSICFWSIQWIPMFYLLPPHFRIVYSSSLQIVWSALVSHLLHRNAETIPGGTLHS